MAIVFACLVAAYIAVLSWPQPLFAHHVRHQNYEVWSDQPIPPQIAQVLDDATRRLRGSAFHAPETPIRLFICNANWRLWIYGQHFSARLGGAADTWNTRNIYIRAADIAGNRIHSPGPGPIADAAQRTLSYYIAHEATHIDVGRQYGRLVTLRYPQWLLEGYADYIGKGGDFDFDENLRLFKAGSEKMAVSKSGLYRGFHLEVAYLLEKEGMAVDALFANPPDQSAVQAKLMAAPLR
ncbi:hypothetical protein C7C56_021350 [Massilia glaciei]|uniref:Peptidase MA-like domain-containing protein n=1 Tax=Massilia glaciei TaxID=1524097 RepID=A0A2U2HFS4_9BURK|nr:hypothetical protein C7C56_021350 [Massilia glaciei]